MKKCLSVLSVAVCLTSTFCYAGPTEMTNSDLKEMIQGLQGSHQTNLLSKNLNGQKQFVLLQAKLDQKPVDSSAVGSVAAGVASAGILYASVKNAKDIYDGFKSIRAFQQMGVPIFGGTRAAYFNMARGAFVSAAGVYASVLIAKEAVKPYLGNNFYFREFNHWTSFTGDPIVKLAKSIDNDANKSAVTSSNLVNVEYVSVDFIEGVFEILTSSLYGYQLESVSSL